MTNALFATNYQATGLVLLVLRIALAVVVFPHGAQKLLGWFGGNGYDGTIVFLTVHMRLIPILAILVVAVEFFGPILLVLGGFTRIAAFAIAVDMIGAVLLVNGANGFFMNWTGQQKGEGVEYFVYAIVVALVVTIGGAGSYSIDSQIAPPDRRRNPR
jgi:putative oxidoreductase